MPVHPSGNEDGLCIFHWPFDLQTAARLWRVSLGNNCYCCGKIELRGTCQGAVLRQEKWRVGMRRYVGAKREK